MRAITAMLVVVFFALLAGAGIYGVTQVVDNDGTLTELWVSDTVRDTIGNHHAPTATRIGNETVVIAPVNAPRGSGDCSLIAFTSELDERWRASVQSDACNIHAFGDPIVADLDDDGSDEVFIASTEKMLHAYDLETGREQFSRELAGWGYAAPVVTDFAPAEGRELIVTDLSGGVFVFDSIGSPLWSQNFSSIYAPIFVEDFDADGTDELVIGEGKNVTVLEHDGTIAQQTSVGGSVTWMTAGQADGDEAIETVAATSSGRVVGVDGRTGDIEWEQKYNKLAAVHAFGDGDGDGQPEVYAVAQDGKLRALDASDGGVEWTTTLTTEDVQMTPPPALGDLDDDEELELVAVSQDGVVSVINPGSGEILALYERDVPIWMRPTLADLDNDGTLEVLVTYGDGRVVALSFSSE